MAAKGKNDKQERTNGIFYFLLLTDSSISLIDKTTLNQFLITVQSHYNTMLWGFIGMNFVMKGQFYKRNYWKMTILWFVWFEVLYPSQ